MVGASKILTVSYGTFSCTLEGFDDPFSTMRSIAEYFRDLAADDRYFGAEPPTPDAEMLHRIAEKEVQRRVEARVQEDGIVLRQMEPSVAPVAAAAAPVAAPEPEVEEPVAATPEPEAVAEAAPEIEEEPAAEIAPEVEEPAAEVEPAENVFAEPEPEVEEPVAAAPEPEVVAEAEPAFEEEPAAETAPEVEEPVAEAEAPAEVFAEPEPIAEAEPEDTIAAAEPEMADEIEPTADLAPELEAIEETPVAEFEEDSFDEPDVDRADGLTQVAPQPLVEPAEGDDSIAAKLSRIRAVVARSRAATAQDDDEFEVPLAPTTDFSASIDSAFADIDESGETPSFDAPEEAAEEFDTVDEDESDDWEDETPEVEEEAPSYGRRDAAATRILTDEQSGLDVQTEEDDDAALMANLASTLSQDDETELQEELEDLEDLQAEADDRVETRILEEDELDDIVAEDETDDSDVLAAIARMNAAETDEAPEPVADLENEDVEDFDELHEEEAPSAEPTERHAAFEPEKSGEAAFDRILEETNSKLDDDEGSRRRSAIAHLKAAVAATKADRLLGKGRKRDQEDAEEQSRYRDDLAKVVRPRRPVTEPRPDPDRFRPSPLEEKPSPLMLVSEQRVDTGENVRKPAIQPRRVAAGNLAVDDAPEFAGGEANFAEFAQQMGATELPDLLEAAAAYSAFVEGHKEFSRPQLMRRVADVERETFTREAGLRSFGQLLRQGKIQKLKRGQFTIPEDTRFNPEARMAGE